MSQKPILSLKRTVMFAYVTLNLLMLFACRSIEASALPVRQVNNGAPSGKPSSSLEQTPTTTLAAATTTTTSGKDSAPATAPALEIMPKDNNNNNKAVAPEDKLQRGPSMATSTSSIEQQPQQYPQKLKRDTKAKVTELELDTQETGYLPSAYHTADSDYAYDAGKNAYGKQASDWSLYDQGNHGLHDKYGDKAWSDQGHNAHNAHGKHDSYGNSYNSHGAGHGSGYYSRDRGYGYEKHYAYDKEIASKHHADSHNSYGSNHGLHDHYGNAGSQSHAHHGHDKYGQLSRYGNHGYGKRGSNLAANHDYGHNVNKGHYYTQNTPQTYSYSSHVPTYRSTHSDYYSPHAGGYLNSYPSYY